MSMSRYFVVVAGNIGAGKTSLTRLMSARLGWDAFYESVDDNPYRPDTVQHMVPKPPEPYQTWADTTLY